jgi:hypothetical protein
LQGIIFEFDSSDGKLQEWERNLRTFAEKEFQKAENELQQRFLCDEFLDIFSNGGVVYMEPTEESFKEIKNDTLLSVIRKAESITNRIEKLQKMTVLAKEVYEIRQKVLEKNWNSAKKMIDDFDTSYIVEFPQISIEFGAINHLSTVEKFICKVEDFSNRG